MVRRKRTVAVIGSFKQHYPEVLAAIEDFRRADCLVLSPAGSSIIEPGIDFVRFTTDREEWEDALVQSVTMERILAADVVYVVCPNGYLGRTTCYEVGRVRQAGIPLYFSEAPVDLPVFIPDANVANSMTVAVASAVFSIETHDAGETGVVERRLVCREAHPG